MVRQTDNGQVVEPVLYEGAGPDDFHAAFLAAFATTSSTVAEALFGQLLNGLHTEPGKPVDSAVANLALALMHEIGPKDVVEAMLAIEMIVAHFAQEFNFTTTSESGDVSSSQMFVALAQRHCANIGKRAARQFRLFSSKDVTGWGAAAVATIRRYG